MTTTMWRNSNPIAGARINGTREYPGIAASFDDQDGKPMVFQLDHRHWEKAMRALGFWDLFKREERLIWGWRSSLRKEIFDIRDT